MKKKMWRFLFICLLELTIISRTFSQQEPIKWDFPVRPGTVEWERLSSYEARLSAYNIPKDILNSISTKALSDACLSYPEWRLIYTRNSYNNGFAYVRSIFNGFNVLLSKVDAADILITKYQSLDPLDIDKNWSLSEQGEYSFRIVYLELLLSDPVFLNNLNKQNENELLVETFNKYNSKIKLPKVYSLYGTCPTALICARILAKNDFIKELNSDKFIYFIHNGMINDANFIDQIFIQTDRYLNLSK